MREFGHSSHEITVTDVEYSKHGDKPLLARIYRPVAAGLFPAVVDVHGGAWVKFDRMLNEAIDRALARCGVVVMAADFRMPPDAGYPGPVEDVNFAIRWLKARAEQYCSRADLVGGVGTSSGGHLLMLNALRPNDLVFAGRKLQSEVPFDASVAFAIACWPVLDPLSRYQMVRAQGRKELIEAHHAFWDSEAQMVEGSPQQILDSGLYTALPPLLLVQGTRDQNLTPHMVERFSLAYGRCGGAVQLKTFDGEEHAFITRNPDSAASRRAITEISTFILERFKILV